MPSTLAKSRTIEDAIERRRTNRIAYQIDKSLPPDVKALYTQRYKRDFEDAFRRLLVGSDHKCEECGCGKPNHQACRMYLEMAGALGAPGQVVLNLLSVLGVKSEDEAKAKIALGNRMQSLQDAGVSARESFESAMDLLRLACQEDPSLKTEALQRLSTEAEVMP